VGSEELRFFAELAPMANVGAAPAAAAYFITVAAK
jgi:hypothetical protein